MAKQEIDIGVEGNDGTGDSIRESFKKVNENFQELYAVFGLGGTIGFRALDDTPSVFTGNESSVPLVNSGGTNISFYKFVSDSGANNNGVSNPSSTTNSVFFQFADPDPTTPNVSGTLKVIINDPHIERDPDPRITKSLSVESPAGYSNDVNTKLRNTGSGDNISTLVNEWNALHSTQPSISTDNLLVSKGYTDDTYINTSGDELTGLLSYDTSVNPAQGREIPAIEDVIARNGSLENRTMLNDLFLNDHPAPLTGSGTPNGADDLQVPSKLYVDTQGYASPTNIFVSTSGDDSQTFTPAGQEGRSLNYAYKTIAKAMERAEEIIESTPFEPGPYVQTISYTSGTQTVNTTISTITGVTSPLSTSATAKSVTETNLIQISHDVTDYLDATYPGFDYNKDTCRRDTKLILQSIALDVQAGGSANYLTRWAGYRYNANPSGIIAKTKQLTQTIAGIRKSQELLSNLLIANGTISTQVRDTYNTRFDEIVNLINNSEDLDVNLVYGNSYEFTFANGGNAAVDQGIAGNPDLRAGKLIQGKTTGARGIITGYTRASTGTTDKITVRLIEPIDFQLGEELEFGQLVRNNQCTVFVESGIYEEQLPIRLPANVSIKGDEFRRTVVRPKKGISTSKWVDTYFYRDIVFDGLPAAQSPIATINNVSGADSSRTPGTYNITANDYAKTGSGQDATFKIVVATGGLATVTVTNGGTGWVIGETVTIDDSDLGSGGGANLTFKVATTGGGYHFTHPQSGDQGKYGYHYNLDSSKVSNISSNAANNPGNFSGAANLIELNKAFITEEVIQFIDANFVNSSAHTYVGGTATNAVQSGGNYTHTFVSAVTNGVTSNAGNLPNAVTGATYNAATGEMVITSNAHLLTTSNTLTIADNALSFVCTMDGNTSTKTYPRSTDPASGSTLAISSVTTDTITINVGASPIVNHDVTDVNYNHATGVMEMTIGSHSLTVGTSIKIADDSLAFTCAADGNTSTHTYPRSTDTYYNTAVNITAVSPTTITVNVGPVGTFTYSATKCRRDTGLIIDGIIKDLKAGGRTATLVNQGAYYSGSVAGQESVTKAAIAYIKTISANVLQNDSGLPFAKLGSITQVFDTDYTAEAQSATNLNALVDLVNFAFDPNYNPPLENNKMDVFMCDDATIVRNITVQKHGGFMMTLDPNGQILTRSPYCQTGSSFSQSKGTRRIFGGGQFIDGYAGNMPAQISAVTNPLKITVTSPTGQGLFIKRPPTPFPFVLAGARYQVNAIDNYNSATGTVELVLDETSNSGNGYTGGTGVDIFIQSGGNRSMLSNDFTQVNDLGFGIAAVNNALTETVSMFTYYCHTGYISSKGSQIRSLGGNNSYGFFGLVSDGADPDEIPTATNLRDDMVFPAKVLNFEAFLDFNSAVPTPAVAVGDTVVQNITGATGKVALLGENNTRIYVTDITGTFNASDDVNADDSSTIIGVPNKVTLQDYSADLNKLFVFVYDLEGFPLNVSEIEINHPSGLYQPYEITNAQEQPDYFNQYTGINDTVSASYTGSSPQSSKAVFTIYKNRTNGYQVKVVGKGAGYAQGETFLVDGQFLGGASSTNDATITISSVSSGTVTGATITGTASFDTSSPVRDSRIWRLNLGTGIEGTADNGLQEVTPHDSKAIIRHKQNFVLNNFPVVNPTTRPSTAFVFTDDADSFTYRTIAFGSTITAGYQTASTERVVTFDANYRYIDLTTNNDYISTVENVGGFTVDPNYTDFLASASPSLSGSKTFGATVGDRFIIINILDATNQARIAEGEMIFAWGGKVHTIDAYAQYSKDFGTGATTIGMIKISDKANSDINWPATSSGIGLSLTNTANVTLKGGLVAGEDAEITVNISTTRATGHDMLDIGTGGFNTSNYPDRIFGSPFGTSVVGSNDAIDSTGNSSKAQAQERNKGRVFAVLTDQDGFFRVGRFFTVDQGTGSVTFNAALVLTNIDGIGFKRGVRVNEFSNDDTFTDAKGDAVPTQTAVEGYINQRLGLDRDGATVSPKIGPGFLSLGGAGFTETPMADVLNMGSNRLTNLALPITGSDGANKTYVDGKTDELNDIGDVTISGVGGVLSGQLLAFTGTAQQSENHDVIGDVLFTRTGAGQLTTSIGTGVIVNGDINATADIAQSKLLMNLATTTLQAPTGNAAAKQGSSGLASFDAANFEITDGWVGIKAGGVSDAEIANTLDFSGKSVTFNTGEIGNTELANNSLTIGSTTVALGATSTSLAGMTGISFSSGDITGFAGISHTGNIVGGANSGSDNGQVIGGSGNRYNTVWATVFNGQATEALYADLAENYLGDKHYESGTVLVFGGEAEVTECNSKGDHRVAGVVTTNPAHLMNSALEGDHVVGLALQGRVPCKVIGIVRKGDMLVTSAVPGYAIVNNSPGIGQVLGKAVSEKDGDAHGTVEIVVGRV